MKKTVLFISTVLLFITSCSEDTEIQKDEEIIFVNKSDIVNSNLFFEIPYEGRSQNKAAANVNIVNNAGDVYINGQQLGTVIIGNQRWTTRDYTEMIEYPDGFETWTAGEQYRGNKFYINEDLPLFDQFKSKVDGGITTRYYIYSLAMLLDDQLKGSDLVELDELNSDYKCTSSWHIPSTEEEFTLRDNLSKSEIVSKLKLRKTGHWYHKLNTKGIEISRYLEAEEASTHWNREYYPNSDPHFGPYGTWRITIAPLDGSNKIQTGDHQALEPILPIRLVQNVTTIQK